MNTFVHEESYRGESLLKELTKVNIMCCGAGAVGSNFINNIVRQGFKNITVIDMDRVESHNISTQIYGRRDVGQFKVSALRNRIAMDIGVNVASIPKKLDASNINKFLVNGSLVIDGFDNTESRQLVTDHCREKGIDCLHVGLYKDVAEVTWNEVYRVPQVVKGMDVCEYPLARNIVIMACTVASDVILRYIEDKIKESYFMTLKDFRVTYKESRSTA